DRSWNAGELEELVPASLGVGEVGDAGENRDGQQAEGEHDREQQRPGLAPPGLAQDGAARRRERVGVRDALRGCRRGHGRGFRTVRVKGATSSRPWGRDDVAEDARCYCAASPNASVRPSSTVVKAKMSSVR